MRKLRKGKINDKVLDMIARNYQQLQQLYADHIHGLYCAKSEDDIFHDTILFVSQDKTVQAEDIHHIISFMRPTIRNSASFLHMTMTI